MEFSGVEKYHFNKRAKNNSSVEHDFYGLSKIWEIGFPTTKLGGWRPLPTLKYFCFSSKFCLLGTYINSKQSDRRGTEEDLIEFYKTVRPMHKRLNWFSMADNSKEGKNDNLIFFFKKKNLLLLLENPNFCSRNVQIYSLETKQNFTNIFNFFDAILMQSLFVIKIFCRSMIGIFDI